MNDQNNNNNRESYYYSYGPFKSNLSEEKEQRELQTSDAHSIDVSNPITSYAYEPVRPVKQRTSYKSMFISFLVGVIIMGSFMVASDKMNLFTAGHVVPETDSVTTGSNYFQNADNSGNGSSISKAAMSMSRPDIADIAERSSPAVVKIETVVKAGNANPRFNDDFFRDFFGDNFQSPPSQENRVGGVGSGFIFERNGYILTNQHVLSNAEEIYVTVLGYKDPFKAELLGADFDLDLAVIKIEGSDFPTLPLGNSADLRVGDWVTAIGNPIGFDHTVSVGVISANEREISIPDGRETRSYQHLLQTDASINPGNSGGPLLNLNGEVIGINTAVSIQAQGIGFAIPTSTIVEVLEQLKNNEVIPKPYIGVALRNIDETWQKNLGLDSLEGSLVTQLEKGSPANKAGLQAGDVIVKINDTDIIDSDTLVARVKEAEVGDKLTVELIRDGKRYEVAIIVGDRNVQ